MDCFSGRLHTIVKQVKVCLHNVYIGFVAKRLDLLGQWIQEINPIRLNIQSLAFLCNYKVDSAPRYSLNPKKFYQQISRILETTRSGTTIVPSLWNFAGVSTVQLPWRLSNLKTMPWCEHPISWLREFAISYNAQSYCLVNRGRGR